METGETSDLSQQKQDLTLLEKQNWGYSWISFLYLYPVFHSFLSGHVASVEKILDPTLIGSSSL